MRENIKRFSEIIASIFSVVAVVGISMILMSVITESSSSDYVTRTADGYGIESYKVVLDVKEDNKVDVDEYIKVNWIEQGHHGIFKFTPEWLEYTGKDGNTIKRKSIVKDLRSETDPYSTDRVKKKARIKIGSANEVLPLGFKDYQISYTYDMGKDPYKGFDEFIFHAYGDFWGTDINNASLEIKMPKSIEGNKINFYLDKYRNVNITEAVDYYVVNNTIYAKFNEEKYRQMQAREKQEYCQLEENKYSYDCSYMDKNDYKGKLDGALTVDIELPNNYFKGGSFNYGYISLSIILVIILLTIYTIYKWIKLGKDYPRRAKTVEFYPPENYSAPEIGYIYNRQPSKKLTIATIIQLASKGYIKIDELDNKKIQITNLYYDEERTKKKENVPKRIINVKRRKTEKDDLSENAYNMMKYLFKGSDTKEIIANVDKFLEVKDELIEKNYIEIISDTDLNKIMNDSKTIKIQKPLSEYEEIVYKILFENKDQIIVSEHDTLYLAFDDINSMVSSKLKDKLVDKESTSAYHSAIFRIILIIILYYVNYYLIADMNPAWSSLYRISYICIFINALFTIFMKRRTKYGEEIEAKVNGFRDFLNKVEKDNLEKLVQQNPTYFYDILPYTYVLNISKKWIKKFEDIKMPELDMGNIDYTNSYSLSKCYYDAPKPISTSSSSSGCSSCGGGCSSCGGGCSSCGGGGSW